MSAQARTSDSRAGAICAVSGSVLLVVGTSLHPHSADPNDAAVAFAEYAADRLWIASHLTQLAGVTLIVAALLFLARALEAAGAGAWARVASGAAVASLAVATALQAVDGIALKAMTDAWAAAPAGQKDAAFRAAFAVRQVEVGLASTAGLLFGLTAILYGVAILDARTLPKWLAGLAVAGGAGLAAAGLVIAYTGFSALAMLINMAASTLVLAWLLAMALWLWRAGSGRP